MRDVNAPAAVSSWEVNAQAVAIPSAKRMPRAPRPASSSERDNPNGSVGSAALENCEPNGSVGNIPGPLQAPQEATRMTDTHQVAASGSQPQEDVDVDESPQTGEGDIHAGDGRQGVNLPASLQTLTIGDHFDQPLQGVNLQAHFPL